MICLQALACKEPQPVYRPHPDPGFPPKSEGANADHGAKRYYASRCAACHGATGRGDGIAARRLNPAPTNFASPDWKLNDDEIRRAIIDGGAAIGKAPTMPGFPDLRTQPEKVTALVALIRSFALR